MDTDLLADMTAEFDPTILREAVGRLDGLTEDERYPYLVRREAKRIIYERDLPYPERRLRERTP